MSKTALEHFQDIKELEVENLLGVTVESTLPYKCKQVEKSINALEILKSKKYIPLDRINPRFWFDKKIYDETCDYEFYLWLCEEECEYVVKEGQKLTQEEFNTLKEVLKNG